MASPQMFRGGKAWPITISASDISGRKGVRDPGWKWVKPSVPGSFDGVEHGRLVLGATSERGCLKTDAAAWRWTQG
ncbi:hypothetical protein VNO77_14622 [Canavalia gladiata]|uniref:Uncharacterized protein n=1 Tax=Canavalia gladiata TaxID=3824 RepID=A0AAN9LYC5_CANGL